MESAEELPRRRIVESFFSVLKKERIKGRINPTRAMAASEVFDYIEMSYNPIRRHGSAGGVSPVEFLRGAARRAAAECLRNSGLSSSSILAMKDELVKKGHADCAEAVERANAQQQQPPDL